MPQAFGSALRRLNAAEVDVVVVTGDLVDHPLEQESTPQELAAGEQDLRLIANALDDALSCPWVVLPGNHDHEALFEQVFGARSCEQEVKGVRLLSFHDWDRPHDPQIQDLMPNVPRRERQEAERFGAILADAADRRPQVHLQHYVITPRCDEGWPHTYSDGESLRDAIVDDGRVRLCLSGHFHTGVEPHRVGPTWFCVGPAFCQAPHPFLLHELTDNSLTTNRIEVGA